MTSYHNKSTTGGQHSFAQIPRANIQRSVFNRSCGLKTTFDAGKLYPMFCDEALPGDTMNLKTTLFARLATPIHPIMDNLYVDIFYFAVPYRLIWNNWQEFNGEQFHPSSSTDFICPVMGNEPTGAPLLGLSDYLGIPPLVPDLEYNSFFHRAYNLIFNEWFRDQNLQNSTLFHLDDGPDTVGWYNIKSRGKRHDYFTSSLPWPQKGDAVELPLGTSAPVVSTGDGIPQFTVDSTTVNLQSSSGSTINAEFSAAVGNDSNAAWFATKLEADLSTATASTINAIRTAFQIQKLYERDARGGTRYTEILQSHFGVHSPDQRLQRPEYLGGGTTRVGIQPVPQTAPPNGETAQGNLAGFGVAVSTGQGFNKSFTEHCLILGIVNARADLNYQQGLPRMFSRSTRWDFYWPALAHIGEQAVLNKEIYAQGSDAGGLDDDLVFGYQERFAEYRYKPSMTTAVMRSSHPQSLDVWHLAQDFGDLPVLNDAFIQDAPPVDRVVAVPSEPDFILDMFFEYKCARPMPTYSVPGQIDRF